MTDEDKEAILEAERCLHAAIDMLAEINYARRAKKVVDMSQLIGQCDRAAVGLFKVISR